MIKSLLGLAFMYALTKTFVQLAFPIAKPIVRYVFWATVILMFYSAVAPQAAKFTRLADDVHGASQTYQGIAQNINSAKGAINAVTGLPEQLENIPIVGVASSKYPPGISLMERLKPSAVRFLIPVAGKVSQEFKGAEHHGIDIAVDVGTPVKASRGGKVSAINHDDVYGNYVMIDHGSGWQTLYAHLSKINVKAGQHIWPDGRDTIGLSGGAKGAEGAGNSKGPHLHFEIRQGKQCVDPQTWFK